MSRVAPLNLLSSVITLDTTLDGWSLLEPRLHGDRGFSYPVAFAVPFSATPVVHVGIVGLDVSKDDNLRVRVRAVDITPAGFTVRAETWLHTQIWSVEVSWLAIGT